MAPCSAQQDLRIMIRDDKKRSYHLITVRGDKRTGL